MGLFGPKKPLDEHEWEWQLAGFKWFFQEFGGREQHLQSQIILPTPEYFTVPNRDDNRAELIFDQVKRHMGMDDWPTQLTAQEPSQLDEPLVATGLYTETSSALGTFSMAQSSQDSYVGKISYDPALIDQPPALVPTFAHELSHYLMSYVKTCPPGGWEVHELTTDLLSVFSGFGIFLGNNARKSEGFSDYDRQGWKSQSNGYLSERALMTAMAISETLAGRDPLKASEFLKKHLVKDLQIACKYIAKRDILDEIMSINLSDFSVEENDTHAAETQTS